ncbi:MAG: helix-turn-helix transcriptional regulator [Propionibacteriaceae bacterium]|nr:helix-turn-helix transcriptional regulator [Propionibacteriaceae bacterium]
MSDDVRAGLAVRRMTRADLARVLGASQVAVGKYVNGCREWPLGVFVAVAGVLSVDPAVLLARASSERAA